jgi:peroxiredoxin (alkyl hydroperoxide reductase subunit C)
LRRLWWGFLGRRVAAVCGVLPEYERVALRGRIITDPHGSLRSVDVHDNAVGRSSEETLEVLQTLRTGGPHPIDWQPSEQALKPGG